MFIYSLLRSKDHYDGDQYIGSKDGSDGMAKDGYDIKRIVIVFLVILSVYTMQAMCWKKQKCEYYIAKPYATSFALPQAHGSTYPKDFFHCWQIRADKPKNEVKICFESFMLEPHQYCDHDKLVIYDGEDDKSRLIDTYCGPTAPDDIISHDGVLYFEFYSDKDVEYEGFTFTYVSGEKDDLREACDKEDEEDKEDDKTKKHSLTTQIVGGIIGGLVLLTGSVVLICLCVSSRRCSCRPGSRTINPDVTSEEGRGQIARRRRNVIRTDRVSHGDSPPNPSLQELETTDTDIPLSIILPIYSGPTEPPPYNGHDVIERLPSSPPPPYSPNDPNPLSVSLCDINMPCVPDSAALRF